MKKKDYFEGHYQNPNRSPHKEKRLAVTVLLILISVTTLIASIYWALFSDTFAVTDIDVVGTASAFPQEEIRSYVYALLNRKRLLVFNQKKSLLFVDTEKLQLRLTERFALKHVAVTPKLPHTLRIEVIERIPTYIVQARSDTVLIDSEGIIIGTDPAAKGDLSVLFALNLNVLSSTTTGNRLFDQSVITFLEDIRNASQSITQGYRIINLDLTRVLVHDIIAKTSEQWVIYMTDTLAPSLQLRNVDRALLDMKDERKKIQYIDVRLPTKIFYK